MWGYSGLFEDLTEIFGVTIKVPVFVIKNDYFIELDVHLFDVLIAQSATWHDAIHLLSRISCMSVRHCHRGP